MSLSDIRKKRVPWMIWWAISVHIAWGCALIIDPGISPIVILVGLHWIVGLGVSGPMVGGVLISAALLAAIGLLLDHRISNGVSFLMLMPQYILLLAALISDTGSVVTGIVESRQIDQLVLFTALCGIMFGAVFHSAAIVERHLRWTTP